MFQFCAPIVPEPVRRWNDLCKEWAARPDLPPLPAGDRLDLCHRLMLAEEREAKEGISTLAVGGTPPGLDFADLFQRTDAGRFRWQDLADKEADRLLDELTR
jgi:hypothetical protein